MDTFGLWIYSTVELGSTSDLYRIGLLYFVMYRLSTKGYFFLYSEQIWAYLQSSFFEAQFFTPEIS